MEKEIEIDEYINGELSGEALTAFEDKLKKDKTLQAQVKRQKEIHNMLLVSKGYQKENAEMEVFLKQLTNKYISKDSPSNKPKNVVDLEPTEMLDATNTGEVDLPNSKKTLMRWLIPAATLAAAAIILFTLFPFGEVDNPTYANKYYQPYEVNFTVRGEENELSKAGKLYQAKNWEAALANFNKYPENLKAQIAKGNCEYQLGQFDKAITTFKKVASGISSYAESAAWYTALCYLQKDNKDAAIMYLKKIGEQPDCTQKAAQLLKELN